MEVSVAVYVRYNIVACVLDEKHTNLRKPAAALEHTKLGIFRSINEQKCMLGGSQSTYLLLLMW